MWHLLGFGRCPPVRQTYVNVLAELDPELLESLLLAFVEQCLPDEAVVATSPNSAVSNSAVSNSAVANSAVANSAVANRTASNNAVPTDVEIWDGKTLRGTRKREERAEQVLVRMDRTLGKIVASHAIPANTNETAVALELVKRLIRKGKLIIADAIYCQRDICQAAVDQGGDYLFTVKGNQPQLLRDIQQAFAIPEGFSPYQVQQSLEQQRTATTTEKNRGRIERRTVTTTTATIDDGYLDWPGARQLIRLDRHTQMANGTIRESTTYAITSLPRDRADAAFLLSGHRSRWLIENRAFHVLDVSLGDDASRTRTGSAARSLHAIRDMTLNLARHLGQSVPNLCRQHALKVDLLLNRLAIVKN
jgi:predicted transposase YbfD/YdcC